MYRVWISTYCPRGEYDELDTYSVETWGEVLDTMRDNGTHRADVTHPNGVNERIR